MISGEDLRNVFLKAVHPTAEQFESSYFRQPELFGVPVFVVGYKGRTIAYVGEYISHKIEKKREGTKTVTKWRILVGKTRIFAVHKNRSIIDIFVNGVIATGALDVISVKGEDFRIYEDRAIFTEIECNEEDIINLGNVMRLEDPVLVIDMTGLLKGEAVDIVGRYTELLYVYRMLQTQLIKMQETLEAQSIEYEIIAGENMALRSQISSLISRLNVVASALAQYKSELLRQKELMAFYINRLEAVKEGKEKIESVLMDYRDFADTTSRIIAEMSERIEQLERLREKGEEIKKEIKKQEERKVGGEKDVKPEKEEEGGRGGK